MKFIFSIFLFSHSLAALELQGIVTEECARHTGIPVYVNDINVTVLALNGVVESIPRAKIDTVAVYNVLENPFVHIPINESTLPYLKSIHLSGSEHHDSVAFAVRFIEDLVFFFSVEGRTLVHPLKDLHRLRPAKEMDEKKLSGKKYRFYFPESEKCPASRENEGDLIKPTRLLADKISIEELYSSFENGYEALESFQERTYLYAKPLLYERNTRLGLILDGKREESGPHMPFYFQWSTGKPYHFQSFTMFGGKPTETLPNAESVMAIRSDVKSHVFHAHFVGNIMGMPAGEDIFSSDDTGGGSSLGTLNAQPSFNYMALMGGDFGPYSFSVGFYFPTFGLASGVEEREVLSSSSSYAVRAMYTTHKWRLRAVASQTEYDNSRPTKDDVLAASNDTEINPPSSYDFRSWFVRPGVEYNLTPEFKVSADVILLNGTYNEIMGGNANYFKFTRTTVQLAVQRAFGNYVNLLGYVNFLNHRFESEFTGAARNDTKTDTKMFGTLEFIF